MDGEEIDGTGLTAEELARVYGVAVEHVNMVTDPAAERLAERRDLASRYGVLEKYLPELETEEGEEDNGS